MTNKISIEQAEHLPMPLIYLASARDLARWQVEQLRWAYEHGERRLNLSCFDTAPMGFDVNDAATLVLGAVMEFLQECGDVESLSVYCGDDASYRAYTAQLAAENPEE